MAMVHPERKKLGPAPPVPQTSKEQNNSSGLYTLTLQPAAEGGSMERHPEESVSIVETLDDADSTLFSRSKDFSFLGKSFMSMVGFAVLGNLW